MSASTLACFLFSIDMTIDRKVHIVEIESEPLDLEPGPSPILSRRLVGS